MRDRTRGLQRQLMAARRSGQEARGGGRALGPGALLRFRKNLSNSIINSRSGDSRVVHVPWHNLCAMMRIAAQFGSLEGPRAAHWMSGLLRRCARAGDAGSAQRAPLLRRMLRKHFREEFAKLPFELRYDPREQDMLRSAWARETGRTRIPVVVRGVLVPECSHGVRDGEAVFRVLGRRGDGESFDVLVDRSVMHQLRKEARARPDPTSPGLF